MNALFSSNSQQSFEQTEDGATLSFNNFKVENNNNNKNKLVVNIKKQEWKKTTNSTPFSIIFLKQIKEKI